MKRDLVYLRHMLDAMLKIAALARDNPGTCHDAPRTTPVGRLDEVRAARELNCAYL